MLAHVHPKRFVLTHCNGHSRSRIKDGRCINDGGEARPVENCGLQEPSQRKSHAEKYNYSPRHTKRLQEDSTSPSTPYLDWDPDSGEILTVKRKADIAILIQDGM